MKFASFLSALAAVCLLGQCTSSPPPAPGDTDYKEKAQSRAYRSGYHHGFMDGDRKLPPSFERYHDEFKPQTRDTFSHGYDVGYSAGRHSAPATPADEDRAYQNGRDAGQADAQNGDQPDHRRYRSQFSTGSEAAFREGYAKGYEEGRKQ